MSKLSWTYLFSRLITGRCPFFGTSGVTHREGFVSHLWRVVLVSWSLAYRMSPFRGFCSHVWMRGRGWRRSQMLDTPSVWNNYLPNLINYGNNFRWARSYFTGKKCSCWYEMTGVRAFCNLPPVGLCGVAHKVTSSLLTALLFGPNEDYVHLLYAVYDSAKHYWMHWLTTASQGNMWNANKINRHHIKRISMLTSNYDTHHGFNVDDVITA